MVREFGDVIFRNADFLYRFIDEYIDNPIYYVLAMEQISMTCELANHIGNWTVLPCVTVDNRMHTIYYKVELKPNKIVISF